MADGPTKRERASSPPKAGGDDRPQGETKGRGPGRNGRPASKEPYNFPKVSLEHCVRLALALEEANAGKPLPDTDMVKLAGYHKVTDWRYLDLIRAASMFGVLKSGGAAVSLTELGQDIVAPGSSGQRRSALSKAFESVALFKSVAEYYRAKPLPQQEYFANTLVREFKVSRERVGLFIDVYSASLAYVQSFGAAQGSPGGGEAAKPGGSVSIIPPQTGRENAAGNVDREFLESCFVLMPFGGWFDVYYKDVYAPAIKAAGMEPVRADDLFQSGSVMEQVWREIDDAKVLLAELTGRNANVFYELGCAHVRVKPVVLVTGSLDDVPFDLRHLRVVQYDIHDPEWAERARASLTLHLQKAKSEPARSIPSPFRELSRVWQSSQMDSAEDEQVAGRRAVQMGATIVEPKLSSNRSEVKENGSSV